MLSSTREDYEEKYKGRYSAHKKDYFENDKTSFLELELSNYTKYYNSLIKIADYFKNKTTKGLRVNPDITKIISDLKKNNEPVFNEIFTIEKTKVVTDKVELDNSFEDDMIRSFIPGKIEIDIKKLTNSITSAKRIIEFINKKLTNPSASVIPENVVDIEGKNTAGTLEKPINKYPQVFLNLKAYELFKKLHETYKSTKNPLADYSFIYRMMIIDGLILDSYKPQMFINWLSKKDYNIHIDKIKTLEKCKTDSKIQTYNITKKLLKIK